MVSFFSKNDGSLIIKKNDNDLLGIELSAQDCISLYRYLNRNHFPNHPNIFVDKSIGDAFH